MFCVCPVIDWKTLICTDMFLLSPVLISGYLFIFNVCMLWWNRDLISLFCLYRMTTKAPLIKYICRWKKAGFQISMQCWINGSTVEIQGNSKCWLFNCIVPVEWIFWIALTLVSLPVTVEQRQHNSNSNSWTQWRRNHINKVLAVYYGTGCKSRAPYLVLGYPAVPPLPH